MSGRGKTSSSLSKELGYDGTYVALLSPRPFAGFHKGRAMLPCILQRQRIPALSSPSYPRTNNTTKNQNACSPSGDAKTRPAGRPETCHMNMQLMNTWNPSTIASTRLLRHDGLRSPAVTASEVTRVWAPDRHWIRRAVSSNSTLHFATWHPASPPQHTSNPSCL